MEQSDEFLFQFMFTVIFLFQSWILVASALIAAADSSGVC